MRYRPFGQTGLSISTLGFGCASYWGKRSFDETAAINLVHRAIEAGVTFFDTGSSYSGGNAEPRLGRALAGVARKNDLLVASKAGTRIGAGGRLYKDFSPAWIAQSVEESLRRLGLDALPLLHLHGPQVRDLTDDLLSALAALRQAGKVRFLSVNSFDAPVIEHVKDLGAFDAVMIDYNVLRPERIALVAALANKGMGVLAGMALAGGAYSAKALAVHDARSLWYALRALKNHRGDLWHGRRFRFLEQEKAGTAAQMALAWVLADPGVSCAVLGTTRAAHLEDVLKAADIALPDDVAARIATAQKAMHV